LNQHRRTILPRRAALLALGAAIWLSACAQLPAQDRVRVNVVGVEPMPGQGLELRFKVKLRVLNPNDTPVDYDGIFIDLDLQGRNFASGVADLKGTVPRFSEQLLEVPLTVSALGALRQMLGLATGGAWPEKLAYELRGKIGGPAFGSRRFDSKGELSLAPVSR